MEKISHTSYVSVLLQLKFVVWVSFKVSAEIIGQLEFQFQYRTETKIVVSVVHYLALSTPCIAFIISTPKLLCFDYSEHSQYVSTFDIITCCSTKVIGI